MEDLAKQSTMGVDITSGGDVPKNASEMDDLAFIGTAAGIFLFGIPPNVLSVLLILRAKQRKSTTTYFLLNLALADIVNLLGTLLIGILPIIGNQGSDIVKDIPIMAKTIANLTLALIAFERYNGLVKTMGPFVEMGKRKVKIILVLTWAVSCAFYAPAIVSRLMMNKQDEESLEVIYYTVCVTVGYVFPLVVVGYCYGKLFTGVSRRGTILGQNCASERALGEKKIFVRTMVVVTVIFMACNLPAVVVKIMKTASYKTPDVDLYRILLILGCVSSTINPYIYGFRSEKYRKQVRELLCCEDDERTAALV